MEFKGNIIINYLENIMKYDTISENYK